MVLLLVAVSLLECKLYDVCFNIELERVGYLCNRESIRCGLPRCCSGKESTCRCGRCKRHRFAPQVRKIPRRINGNLLQ